MHVPLKTGYYHIINDEWSNFAALDNLDAGGNAIVRAEANDESETIKWYIKQLSNGNYLFCSGRNTPRLHATVGRPGPNVSIEGTLAHHNQQWMIGDTRIVGSYVIRKTDNQYIWSLPDGEIGTTVLLTEHFNAGRARWRFVSTTPPVNNVASDSPVSIPATPGISQPQVDNGPPTVLKGTAVQVSGIVAIQNNANNYMRVTSNNGISFNSHYRDDYALFAVRSLGGKIALISLKSGKHVNMYYIDDVMCKGPGGGLSLGVQRRDDGHFNLTISGYQGQNGETHYMSSEVGNAGYGGSLAVRKSADASCQLTIEKLVYFDFHGVVTLRNRSQYLMKTTGDRGLVFDTPVYDDDARFILQVRGRKFCLIGNNGLHLNLHFSGSTSYIRCDGGGEGVDFAVEMQAGHICLSISGQGKNGNETHYLTGVESDSGGYGSLEVTSTRNADCWFRFENVSRQ